jgi:hypothetical protein
MGAGKPCPQVLHTQFFQESVMIIGIEFDRTVTESGKKFYRVAPVIVSNSKYNKDQVSKIIASVTVIFAFVYFVTVIMQQ